MPRPPHTSNLGVPGERTGADAELVERGVEEGALPGTARSLPGKAAENRKKSGNPSARVRNKCALSAAVRHVLLLHMHGDMVTW